MCHLSVPSCFHQKEQETVLWCYGNVIGGKRRHTELKLSQSMTMGGGWERPKQEADWNLELVLGVLGKFGREHM